MSDSFQPVEQQLHIIQALDQIRDSTGDEEDPARMFTAMCRCLSEEFEIDSCGILLLASDNEGIELIASAGMSDEDVLALGRTTFKGEEAVPVNSFGLPLKLSGEQLGAVVLRRSGRDFDETERALLRVAITQIDSAVLQARTIWKYRQRNVELAAIHEIDHLRDETPNETDLIGGFTNSLLHYFNAELCMVMLTHYESGEMILRGVVDRTALPSEALSAIRDIVAEIDNVQPIQAPRDFPNLTLLAGPLVVSDERLGGIVIGRRGRFRASEQRLLTVMAAQMDSAIAYSRIHQQLEQRNKELEVIYRIDSIRDQEVEFDSLLQKVLMELCNVVSGEAGYILLYSDQDEKPFEFIMSTVSGAQDLTRYGDALQEFSRETLDSGHMMCDNDLNLDEVRSVVAIPLILNEKIIGVFGAVNSQNPRGFSREDRKLLSAITSQVDTAIFERLERRRMRALLSRSVDPNVLNYLLEQADSAQLLTGVRVQLSVLFADLRGSTQWTERTEPEILVTILNDFLGQMTDVIFKYGGTLDKFVGDEVIGLFGSPLYLDDHAERAARAALEMQQIQAQLIADYAAAGARTAADGSRHQPPARSSPANSARRSAPISRRWAGRSTWGRGCVPLPGRAKSTSARRPMNSSRTRSRCRRWNR